MNKHTTMTNYDNYNRNFMAALFGEENEEAARKITTEFNDRDVETANSLIQSGTGGEARQQAELAASRIRTKLRRMFDNRHDYVWLVHPNVVPTTQQTMLSPDAIVKLLTAGHSYKLVSEKITKMFREQAVSSLKGLDILVFNVPAPNEDAVAVLRDLLGPTQKVPLPDKGDDALIRGVTDYVLWGGSYPTYIKRLAQLNSCPRIEFVVGERPKLIKELFDEQLAEFKRVAKATKRERGPIELRQWLAGCMFNTTSKAGCPFMGTHAEAVEKLLTLNKDKDTAWAIQMRKALKNTQEEKWGKGVKRPGRFSHPWDFYKAVPKVVVAEVQKVKAGEEKTRIIYQTPELVRLFLKPYTEQMHKAMMNMPGVMLGFSWVRGGADRLIQLFVAELGVSSHEDLVWICFDISGMDLDDDSRKIKMYYAAIWAGAGRCRCQQRRGAETVRGLCRDHCRSLRGHCSRHSYPRCRRVAQWRRWNL